MDFNRLATEQSIETTKKALENKGYAVSVVGNGAEALELIKKIIPAGASVMNGSSTTLGQIGFSDFLKSGEHGWHNFHKSIQAEVDPTKRATLRQQSVHSEYYLGSVHALTENGEMIIASNTGSQLPHIAFTSPNLIFVVSTKKIVPDLVAGMERLSQHVVPLEDKRLMEKYGSHTAPNKVLVFNGENLAWDGK